MVKLDILNIIDLKWKGVRLLMFCYLAINNIQANSITNYNNKSNSYINISYSNEIHSCQVTNNYEPEVFSITNNLLRQVGQNPHIKGTIVVIKGTVIDRHCIPVPDAKVYLWQVDSNGKYPYTPLKNSIDQSLISNNNLESTFTGSGVTTTNNNGNFYFITIYPAAVHNILPHFNFRAEHTELGSLQTVHIIKNDIRFKISCNDHMLYNNIDNYFIVEHVTLVMPLASKLRRYILHASTKHNAN
ncbi:intradiol ring-cleavage dioxygenase [Orientia tsutsugamushi]|uniref:Intradiol ring-cleavage dioxygenase n=1 Tax=Orientia tsutsugamushi TaxID=784 RepID=A0A2U3RCD8_ORITS|nr:intradiol ring-cleavage dioxygenase [Orientia tsutsugamushi]